MLKENSLFTPFLIYTFRELLLIQVLLETDTKVELIVQDGLRLDTKTIQSSHKVLGGGY